MFIFRILFICLLFFVNFVSATNANMVYKNSQFYTYNDEYSGLSVDIPQFCKPEIINNDKNENAWIAAKFNHSPDLFITVFNSKKDENAPINFLKLQPEQSEYYRTILLKLIAPGDIIIKKNIVKTASGFQGLSVATMSYAGNDKRIKYYFLFVNNHVMTLIVYDALEANLPQNSNNILDSISSFNFN